MITSTCKRAACEIVSPMIAGAQTFCSAECEAIHAAVYTAPERGEFSWLGPAPQAAGDDVEGWPS